MSSERDGTPPIDPGAGQEALHRAVRAVIARGRLPHALLLVGEGGLGKAQLARWIVQARWCKAETPPCGVCPTCRKVATSNHPDVTVVQRDPSPDDDPSGLGSKFEITVDQVRQLIVAQLGLASIEGGGRSVVVLGADEMNEGAQNALLKTLEEPPRGAFLVLTCAREDALLDTVRSRCQVLRLQPLDAAAMEAVLGRPPGPLAGLARGRPLRLAELERFPVSDLLRAADGVLSGRLNAAAFAKALREVLEQAAADAPEGADEASLRRLLLEVLGTRLADLAALAGGGDPSRLRTPPPDPADWPSGLPPADALLAAAGELLEAERDVRRHVPAAVAWMALGDAWAARMGVYGSAGPKT